MKVELRPTTPDDWQRLVATPPPWRLWAQTAWHDGSPIAIGGIAFLPGHVCYGFLEGHDALRRFPVTMHRIVRQGLAELRSRGIRRVVAQGDAFVPAAERWLARLGFEPTMIGKERIWIWQSCRP